MSIGKKSRKRNVTVFVVGASTDTIFGCFFCFLIFFRFYPKGTTTHSSEQFVMGHDDRVMLEPSPIYGRQLEGEARQFAPYHN